MIMVRNRLQVGKVLRMGYETSTLELKKGSVIQNLV